ncbi:MAG: hypothetical protein ACPGVC_11150 [Salibacteraceae bacterium]
MIINLGLWPIAVIGLTALIIGIALPKPNKRSLVVSNSQLVQSKNDDKAMAAVGISIGLVILILVVGAIMLIRIMFAI